MTDTIAQINLDKPLEGSQEATESPTKRRLRVSWTSNAEFTPSGYSQQTYDLKRKFLQSGWDSSNFSLINMFGQLGGITRDFEGIINYPNIAHPMGSDAMIHHGRHFNADVVFTLFDVWNANPDDLRQIPRFIPWCPIDSDPVQPLMLQNLRFANRILAMSKFGQKILQDNGFSSTYIPHHVDTNIFKPMDKAEAKKAFGLTPDAFVFGMVAANKDALPRKSFGQVLEAFAQFLKKYPNSFLYIHTNPDQMGGYLIKQHASLLGINERLLFPDLYKWMFTITKNEMPLVFNLFDVLLSPSSTEGFGIPIIEAQSCGIPVIVNSYTSMPELVIEGETGYITKIGCQHMMPNGQFMKFPDPEDLYQKMLRIKGMKLEVMGERARKHIIANYDLDMIWAEKWLPYLLKLQKEIYPDQLTNPTATA